MRLKELRQTDGSEFIKYCEDLAQQAIIEFDKKVLSGELLESDWDTFFAGKLNEVSGDE